MDELDFTRPQPAAAAPSAPMKPAASRFYDRDVAARLFRESGRAERFAPGAVLFAEDQKAAGGLFSRGAAARMYFLAEGEVTLSSGGRRLDTIGPGEIVGEMAVITERPRSATATAKSECAAYSMGAEEFRGALARSPEFAMMLMSVMFDRLRFASARLATRRGPLTASPEEPPVFDAVLLEKLEATLPRAATARYGPEAVIMREGQGGAYMYVVKSGSVAVGVGNRLLAVVNPGGTFGEMALVDQSPRSATALARTECELLAIDRAALLEAMRAQPAVSIALLRAVAERLRRTTAQAA